MDFLFEIIKRLMKLVYVPLVHGNREVNFCLKCLRHEESESVMQRPFLLAFTVLRVNLMCRLKLHHKKLSVGKTYLSGNLLRPPVYDLAMQVLACRQVVTDLIGSALIMLKNEDDFFAEVEQALGLPGFAKLRKRYGSPAKPLIQIYEKLERKFGQNISFVPELELAAQRYVPNRYAYRLFDIAQYNQVKIRAVVPSSYPYSFFDALLRRHGMHVDTLVITSEKRAPLLNAAKRMMQRSAVFSANFKFTRWAVKRNRRPLYYYPPQKLLQYVPGPELSPAFKEVYFGLCGLHLFGVETKHSEAYERAYMCLAPAVFAGLKELPEDATKEQVRAVEDFMRAFGDYIKKHDPGFVVPEKDALKLYDAMEVRP